MYFIPVGMVADTGTIDWLATARNLLLVTHGNIIGGSAFVAMVYWIVYLRGKDESFGSG